MFELLFGALRGFVALLWEGVMWIIMGLIAEPVALRSTDSTSHATLAEDFATIDPCGLGAEAGDFYREAAAEATALVMSSGARAQGRCAVVIRAVLDSRGCSATPLDIRFCARALAAQLRAQNRV